ncbi:hypothetical protein GALL_68660 [mine drainage metagenome]|uniref:Uncharacterized protein n=1 Tax=mine drainage metagenome TaxID=410659 RepID=A0A1J5T505_9ZZZZ
MAIVLVIVAVLLAGLLPTISGQMEQQRRAETRKQLEEIRAALIGYAATQTPPRLPCPAKPTLATGTTGAGVADCTIAPTRTGVLPWVTLGTSETDAWGRRFTYTVANSGGGDFATSFVLSSTGNLNVLSSSTGVCPNVGCVGSNIPAVIISHGPNGLGAYTPQGTKLANSTDTGEQTNYAGGITFVSQDPSSTYDDLVVWVSPNTLFNRMVAAGKLP